MRPPGSWPRLSAADDPGGFAVKIGKKQRLLKIPVGNFAGKFHGVYKTFVADPVTQYPVGFAIKPYIQWRYAPGSIKGSDNGYRCKGFRVYY